MEIPLKNITYYDEVKVPRKKENVIAICSKKTYTKVFDSFFKHQTFNLFEFFSALFEPHG